MEGSFGRWWMTVVSGPRSRLPGNLTAWMGARLVFEYLGGEVADQEQPTLMGIGFPGLVASAEVLVWDLLAVRAGVTYQTFWTETEAPADDDDAGTHQMGQEFAWSTDLGLALGDFRIDGTVSHSLYFRGPCFLGGPEPIILEEDDEYEDPPTPPRFASPTRANRVWAAAATGHVASMRVVSPAEPVRSGSNARMGSAFRAPRGVAARTAATTTAAEASATAHVRRAVRALTACARVSAHRTAKVVHVATTAAAGPAARAFRRTTASTASAHALPGAPSPAGLAATTDAGESAERVAARLPSAASTAAAPAIPWSLGARTGAGKASRT